MLVVKVEVWPGGDGDKAFEISRIGIANVSSLSTFSDYEVTALLGRDTGKEEVVRAEVQNHERAAGWMTLVRRVLTTLVLRKELAVDAPYDDPVAVHLRRGGHV